MMYKIQPPVEAVEGVEGEGGVVMEGGEGGEPEDNTVYRYVPPEPKEWISLGSEVEIEDETVTEARPKVCMC